MDWSPWICKSSTDVVGCGRFGDVFRGEWKNLPSVAAEEELPSVAIKVVRGAVPDADEDAKRSIKQLVREITVWQSLSHKNIVPFLGISYAFDQWRPALISVWMTNGQVPSCHQIINHLNIPQAGQLNDFLKRNTLSLEDKMDVSSGIADGLCYLHDRGITHGNLKAINVLVNHLGHPCLSDLGLSRLLTDEGSLWATTTYNAHGTVRWMSPELLDGPQLLPSKASDVYAFAMTVMEVFSGKVPLFDIRTDGQVICAVINRQERPRQRDASNMNEAAWNLIVRCWAHDVNDRPDMRQVVIELNEIRLRMSRDSRRLSFLRELASPLG